MVRQTFVLSLAVLSLVCATTISPLSAAAHELLPAEIIELMKSNPNLTEKDIDAYVAARSKLSELDVDTGKVEAIQLGADDTAGIWSIILTFIQLGIQHILEGPDHVLFVLSLLLVFTNIRDILRLVTAFTIAHSISFIIAGFGLIVLPPRIVEPLIALSIAYVAITTVFFQSSRLFSPSGWSKVASVFFFGLFHGLGFAGLLTDFVIPERNFLWALFSFNIGIEFGQLCILGLALPYIFLFRHKAWYPTFVRFSAIAIAQLALIWVVERAFGLSIIS